MEHLVAVVILLLAFPSSGNSLTPRKLEQIALEYRNHTAISNFRLLNRNPRIRTCPDPNPFLRVNITSGSRLSDEGFVTVDVAGVLVPAATDWVAMISPSHANISDCPLNAIQYMQTGDFSTLPLLCHYPVKAQYVNNDPDYLSCKKYTCQKLVNGVCVIKICGATLKFHVVNIRTDIKFVFFAGGFLTPCVLAVSDSASFINPNMPLHAHLSAIDSTTTSMRVTWVSGNNQSQKVQYGNGQSVISKATTFTQDDMCTSPLHSPAKDFGWHDPGYIHSAVMTGLQPSTIFSYKYGSDSTGWSDEIMFKTPPVGGSNEVNFIAFGDMGKAPRDLSLEHYIQPGSISVINAIRDEIKSGSIDTIFHIGDVSYATGFLVEWDYFLNLITPVASTISYMTAIGNHERDYINTGSVYITPDSGGECGVPYETYFPMPTVEKDKPWYSIEHGSVHFTVISTEHNWSANSDQYNWMNKDMANVDRSRTPWLIFMGHRPMYSSSFDSVDKSFVQAVESLLLTNKVDLALFGHVHNYERTCAVYQSKCKTMPKRDANGVDVYDGSNYTAPIHAVIGMAGFSLDSFPNNVKSWSLVRESKFGYAKVQATKTNLTIQFVNSDTKNVEDAFRITKQ